MDESPKLMRQAEVEEWLLRIREWAPEAKRANRSIRAIALLGSWARNEARQDSDLDVLMLCEQPEAFRSDTDWPRELFGTRIVSWRDADYGAVWSRHLLLSEPGEAHRLGVEIELAFGHPSWAATDPIDPGTAEVLRGGCKVLYDPQDLLLSLLNAASGNLADAKGP